MANDPARDARRAAHDQARRDFEAARLERDALAEAGKRADAMRKHREAEQIVRDYRKGKH